METTAAQPVPVQKTQAELLHEARVRKERRFRRNVALTWIFMLAILLLLVVRALWRLLGGIIEVAGGGPGQGKPAVKLVRDPACGTYVAPGNALSLTSGGSTYYFCSEKCREQFSGRR